MQVVVETPEYQKHANKCMDLRSRKEAIDYISRNPRSGDLIVGTGGVRKIRWSGDSYRGKKGGVRVIYYYHNETIPIFLFTVYAKSEKNNLSLEERNELRKITKAIIKEYEN